MTSLAAEEYAWFVENQKEVLKYRAKNIAIVGKEIVASARSAKVAYDIANKKYPGRSPLLHYVPEGDLYVF